MHRVCQKVNRNQKFHQFSDSRFSTLGVRFGQRLVVIVIDRMGRTNNAGEPLEFISYLKVNGSALHFPDGVFKKHSVLFLSDERVYLDWMLNKSHKK